MQLIAHELAHAEEQRRQEGSQAGIKLNFGIFGSGYSENNSGYSENKGRLRKPEMSNAAGIARSNEISDFIAQGLKSHDQNSQILAMLAVAGRLDGFLYSLRTMRGDRTLRNDLINFARNTDSNLEEICIGLAGDFLLNSDNWKLMKMAMGDESVKLSDNFWQCYYKLAEGGPEIGVKGGFKF